MIAFTVFTLRLFAVPFRLAVYIARAVVLAASADPEASTVFWAIVAAVLASWAAVRLVRAAGRHADASRAHREPDVREPDEFEQIIRREWPDGPPPVRHTVKRRRIPSVRIPRRRVRHTTASSDRRTR